jgi:hypothetical protein
MKSPFPGMDPYLEPHWLDVHTHLVAYAADSLNAMLPEDLIARSEERVAVEAPGRAEEWIHPDVRVLEAFGPATGVKVGPVQGTGNGGVALAPLRLRLLRERATERFIKIIETSGDRLITVIEFLSPSNKMGRGLRKYLRKRRVLLNGNVNVMEIDLVRAGDWRRLLRPYAIPPEGQSTYRAMIRTPEDPDTVYLHPMPLGQPLPAVKIPLREGETPVELELQPLIEQAYRNGRYNRTIDYSKQPDPPLPPQDQTWVDDLLRAAGRR